MICWSKVRKGFDHLHDLVTTTSYPPKVLDEAQHNKVCLLVLGLTGKFPGCLVTYMGIKASTNKIKVII